MAQPRDWQGMKAMSARLLKECSVADMETWNQRITTGGFSDEQALLSVNQPQAACTPDHLLRHTAAQDTARGADCVAEGSCRGAWPSIGQRGEGQPSGGLLWAGALSVAGSRRSRAMAARVAVVERGQQ